MGAVPLHPHRSRNAQKKECPLYLRAHRVGVLDVTCAELPAALVERYLAIKREGRL